MPEQRLVTDSSGVTIDTDRYAPEPGQGSLPNAVAIDGPPRFAHKTSELIAQGVVSENVQLYVEPNHRIAKEIAHTLTTNHADQHGFNQRGVVHFVGKGRAHGEHSNSCTHCNRVRDADEAQAYHFKCLSRARTAIQRNQMVTADTFRQFEHEICPYDGLRAAVSEADYITTVSEKFESAISEIEGSYDVVIDEESALSSFLPSTAGLGTLKTVTDLSGNRVGVESETNSLFFDPAMSDMDCQLENLRDTIAAKLESEDYSRVPGRFRVLEQASEQLVEWRDGVVETLYESDVTASSEAADIIAENEPEFDPFEITTENQVRKAFEFLRFQLPFQPGTEILEAFIGGGMVRSHPGEPLTEIFLIPDPDFGVVLYEDKLTTAENIRLVGATQARYFLQSLGYVVDDRYLKDMSGYSYDDYNLIALNSENEFQRRGVITKISKRLAEARQHNLLISGSGTRAAQATETIGTHQAYYFKGDSTYERNYRLMAGDDQAVTTHMGSRLTRGVDVDTQVTCIRSYQFASPRWLETDYAGIGRYENMIETHNAMLRGAGQGEQHISVIPLLPEFYWDIDDEIEVYDLEESDEASIIDDIVDRILELLDVVTADLVCPLCEGQFVTPEGFQNHECVDVRDSSADR